MVKTNFSPETAQTLMLAYEHRIEALLSHIEQLKKINDKYLKLKK
jgi:hypothetical protein